MDNLLIVTVPLGCIAVTTTLWMAYRSIKQTRCEHEFVEVTTTDYRREFHCPKCGRIGYQDRVPEYLERIQTLQSQLIQKENTHGT